MCVQEEITQGVVSLSVETGKMTADLLQKAVKKVLEEMQKKPSQRSLHQGKQTLHQLKQHGASLTNIEITEQNIKSISTICTAGLPSAFFPVWTPMEHFVPPLVWSRTALRGLVYPSAVATSVPQNNTLPFCSKVRMLPNSGLLKISI